MSKTYTLTRYYPSGNGGDYLYDETKRTMFAFQPNTIFWSIQPKIGDSVRIEDDGRIIYVNDVLAYTAGGEQEEAIKKSREDYIYNLKASKGFI